MRSRFMVRPLVRFSIRRPRTVVVAIAAATVGAALLVPGIQLRLDGRSLIPAGHPSMVESDRAAELFGLRDVVVIAVRSDETGIYTPEGLRLVAAVSEDLSQVPGVVPLTVASLATLPRITIRNDTIDLRPLLAAGREPDAALAGQVREETEAFDLDNGILASSDGRTAAVYAEVEPDADRAAVQRGVEALAARHRRHPFQVAYSGTALAQAELGAAAASDLARLIPIVLLITGAVITLAFRHPLPAVVSLMEVGASLVWTTGLMGAVGERVFVTTLALPVVVLVIGVSDDLYLLKRYFTAVRTSPGRPREELVFEALDEARIPILLTSLTTMIGLLSLTATSIEPQRVFGQYGALSVAISTCFSFSLVPALLALAPLPAARLHTASRPWGEQVTLAFLALIDRVGPRNVAVAVAVAAAAAGVLATQQRIDDSWIRNLPPGSPTVEGDRRINEWLAGTNTLEILFDSGRTNGFLEPDALAALGTIEEALRASPAVGAVHSAYTDVLRVSAALTGVTTAEYRRSLALAGRLPTKVEVMQSVMLLDSLGRSSLSDRLDDEYRRARMTVFVRSASYSRIAEILRIVHATDPHFGPSRIVPFGDGWIGHTTIGLLVRGHILSIALGMVSNTAVLAVLLRSPVAALVAMAPVTVGIVLVFGFLAAAGMALGTANSMFAAIALGVGVDYSIHLTAACRQRARSAHSLADAVRDATVATGPAIATSAVALPAGFLVLLFSAVLPNRELGALIALSMVACAVMTLALVPSLLLLVGSRSERQEASATPHSAAVHDRRR